jgi:hypothetical protein
MVHPGECMNPNSSTPGNNLTSKSYLSSHVEGVSESNLLLETLLQYPFSSLIITPLIATISMEFTPTNLKTDNFHQGPLQKHHGFIYYRWWNGNLFEWPENLQQRNHQIDCRPTESWIHRKSLERMIPILARRKISAVQRQPKP